MFNKKSDLKSRKRLAREKKITLMRKKKVNNEWQNFLNFCKSVKNFWRRNKLFIKNIFIIFIILLILNKPTYYVFIFFLKYNLTTQILYHFLQKIISNGVINFIDFWNVHFICPALFNDLKPLLYDIHKAYNLIFFLNIKLLFNTVYWLMYLVFCVIYYFNLNSWKYTLKIQNFIKNITECYIFTTITMIISIFL